MAKKKQETVISIHEVTKSFSAAGASGTLDVLRGITFEISKAQIVAIVGASGAGKSTLLHILGTLDRPTGGRVLYGEEDVFAMDDEQLARFRNRRVGFVFQFHHLLPEFTALENVAMPAMIGGAGIDAAMERASSVLSMVGLAQRAEHKPPQLSGGEQQRVAVARALVNSPLIVLADEPTGNLDSSNAGVVTDLIGGLRKDSGQTFVVVTHNEKLAREADHVIRIVDGLVAKG